MSYINSTGVPTCVPTCPTNEAIPLMVGGLCDSMCTFYINNSVWYCAPTCSELGLRLRLYDSSTMRM